ncbi:hypothetical protein GP486_008265, partial [Trichoglossum hirsutum]
MRGSGSKLKLRSLGPAADIRRSFISTQVGQANKIWSNKASVTSPFKRNRYASSLENQGSEASTYKLPSSASPIDLQRDPKSEDSTRKILRPHELFHQFSKSPLPEIRRRAAFIKQHAYCPHPAHRQTRVANSPNDPETRKLSGASQPPMHADFECIDCGIPVYCSEEHWADDFENHLDICDTLREINEDDHDLRSGRFFPEFEYPEPQMEEALVNMTNWDTFLYSREFRAINEDRSMRQVTRLLTYPVTIGSFLHELSPYNIRSGGRLTVEGLKSLSGPFPPPFLFLRFIMQAANNWYLKALRYNLHPPRSGAGIDIKGIRPSAPPNRIFILGARAESSLPREVWIQLSYMFPRAKFHLIFIGPESMANRDAEFPLPDRTPGNPFGAIVEDRISHHLKISTFVEYYHTLHKAGAFQPYDPYFDCFVLFHPGLGHPASSHEWEETVPQLLETKVPVLATGYTEWDMQRDLKWVQERVGGEVDILLEPGENRFRSL